MATGSRDGGLASVLNGLGIGPNERRQLFTEGPLGLGTGTSTALPGGLEERARAVAVPGPSVAAARPGLLCCAVCFVPTGKDGAPLLQCGGCGYVAYCDKEHQKLDWKMHKVFCKNAGRPPTGPTSAELKLEVPVWQTETLTPEQRENWILTQKEIDIICAEHLIGSQEGAIEQMAAVLSDVELLFGRGNPATVSALFIMAKLLTNMAKYEEALPYSKRALEIVEDRFGAADIRIVSYLSAHQGVISGLGRYEEELTLAERCLAITEAALGPNDPHVSTCLGFVATCLASLRRKPAAIPLMRRALAIKTAVLGAASHRDLVTERHNLGSLLSDSGMHREARPLLEAALKSFEVTEGRHSINYAYCANHLADCIVEVDGLGGYPAALPLFELSAKVLEDTFGERNLDFVGALSHLAVANAKTGRWQAAADQMGRCASLFADEYGAQDARALAAQKHYKIYLGNAQEGVKP